MAWFPEAISRIYKLIRNSTGKITDSFMNRRIEKYTEELDNIPDE